MINAVVRRSGSKLHWGIDGPGDILDAVPGVRLLAWESVFDSDTFDLVSPRISLAGQGDGGGAGFADDGAIPPLRVRGTQTGSGSREVLSAGWCCNFYLRLRRYQP